MRLLPLLGSALVIKQSDSLPKNEHYLPNDTFYPFGWRSDHTKQIQFNAASITMSNDLNHSSSTSSKTSLGIGLVGFGTVGPGVWEILERNADLISNRSGVQLEIMSIAVRDINKARHGRGAYWWHDHRL
jgi:hypothetical protein